MSEAVEEIKAYAEYFDISEEEARQEIMKRKSGLTGAKEVKTLKADERGRVNLGVDYAHEAVRVAIVEVVDNG